MALLHSSKTFLSILGISVFHLSIANGNEELILLILQYLLRGGVSKLSMESALSPLSVALLFKRNSILTLLINKSFDVNAATLYTGKYSILLVVDKLVHFNMYIGLPNAGIKNIIGFLFLNFTCRNYFTLV